MKANQSASSCNFSRFVIFSDRKTQRYMIIIEIGGYENLTLIVAIDSEFRFTDDDVMKYKYSDNHQKRNE